MKHYDKFIEGLQEEVQVPANVWEKFENTLAELPDKPSAKNPHFRRWLISAASAAAVLALGTGFCFTNPVAAQQIASKLPIIGKLFEEVEKEVTFSGDYSEKGEALSESDMVYAVENSGAKITASEVYCDGYSFFMTAELYIEAGGLTKIPSHYSDSKGESTAQTMYTGGTWKIQGQTEPQRLENNYFEGKAVDDNTFIGMMKIDLDTIEAQDAVLELQLTQIGYDDVEEIEDEDISASHKIDGEWNLSIPFTVDIESARQIRVDQKSENGYGISKVFVSPYQVVVFTDVPYTSMAEVEGYSREDFDKMWEEKTEGMEEPPEPPFTYEEYLEQKQYEFCEVAVYNQDGIALDSRGSDYTKSVFAVKDMKIDKLQIFLSDDAEVILAKTQNIDEARENSILEVTVDAE